MGRPTGTPPPEYIAQVEDRDRVRVPTLIGAALFCVLFWTAIGVALVAVL
jgi:hypothetical protein